MSWRGRPHEIGPSHFCPHCIAERALLTNKLIGPYDRSRGGRAESEALITG